MEPTKDTLQKFGLDLKTLNPILLKCAPPHDWFVENVKTTVTYEIIDKLFPMSEKKAKYIPIEKTFQVNKKIFIWSMPHNSLMLCAPYYVKDRGFIFLNHEKFYGLTTIPSGPIDFMFIRDNQLCKRIIE